MLMLCMLCATLHIHIHLHLPTALRSRPLWTFLDLFYFIINISHLVLMIYCSHHKTFQLLFTFWKLLICSASSEKVVPDSKPAEHRGNTNCLKGFSTLRTPGNRELRESFYFFFISAKEFLELLLRILTCYGNNIYK